MELEIVAKYIKTNEHLNANPNKQKLLIKINKFILKLYI